jgi:uncharacterized protein (TIGR03118 family)
MRGAYTVVLFLGLTTSNAIAGSVGFAQINLVSDGAVPANFIDPDLRNPWGISFGPMTPFWIADNGTGLSTLYNGAGLKQGLVVTIPPAPANPFTTATPTGTVFNSGAASGAFMSDRFLFATEDGTITGWSPGLGTTGAVRVDNSSSAVYKGLAIAGNRIYATNFANGTVDVFDANYAQILPGAFTDPTLPSGYAPFGIENIGGSIYVTYAKKEPGGDDDVPGPGFGFVDKFDTDGNLTQRLVTGIPGDPNSPLNSPWGMASAPSTFGDLAGLLLVGNFGDGRINAFDPVTGAFVSSLNDSLGNPIVNDGLWALKFGNSGPGFSPDTLYFTAGLNGEADGLFGSLQSEVPEPSASWLMGGGLLLALWLRKRISAKFQPLQAVPR